jgi:hypothetical protein
MTKRIATKRRGAFTETLALVFQVRDLELLGLASPSAESQTLQRLGGS